MAEQTLTLEQILQICDEAIAEHNANLHKKLLLAFEAREEAGDH